MNRRSVKLKKVEVNGKSARKFEGGYPLISKDDLVNASDFNDGEWISLINHDHFVAKGYFAEAGKGSGWILTIRENEDIDQKFFAKLFRTALLRRQAVVNDDEITSYRFFNGIGDGLGGLTIDKFDDCYVFEYENEAIYYQNKLIMAAFNEVISKAKTIIVRKRGTKKRPETSQLVVGDSKNVPTTITEYGIQYPVDLIATPMIAPALEYRQIRQIVRNDSNKTTFLNLFAAQNGLTIASAVGGALKTVTVDDSKRTVGEVENQLELNQTLSEGHETRAMDVFGYLDYAIKHELQFDTVSVNPPAFLRGKKRTFNIQKDLQDLLLQAATVTKKGGNLLVLVRDSNITEKKMNEVISSLVSSTNGEFSVKERLESQLDFTISSEYRHADQLKSYILIRH